MPYLFPPFEWWPKGQMVRVLTGKDGGCVAVFGERVWRGVSGTDPVFLPTPAQMAQGLADAPKGTVTWVDMTSDGGLTLENSFLAMAALLPPHVVLVNADTAARLAVDATPP